MSIDAREGALSNYDFTNAVEYHHGKFPPETLDLSILIGPLGEAREALARYDQMLKTLRNSSLLLAPMRRQEAVVSSRMEGTVTTLDALLQYEAENEEVGVAVERTRNDTLETLLYARAMREAEEALEEGYTLSNNLLQGIHRTLLGSGRGKDKNPGNFKDQQNFIADKIRRLVLFVPIAPIHLASGLDALHDYISGENAPDPLIRIAIAHAEFEALHPFDDGNGRIGRMLVTLMLWREELINGPYFFLSSYFEREKEEYLERLRMVSSDGDWSGWCAFFFRAITEAARESLATVERITGLYDEMRGEFRAATNSQWHSVALDFVFETPIFKNKRFVVTMVKDCEIGEATASRFTRELARRGLLTTVRQGSGRSSAIYAFKPLLEILRV